LPRIFAAAVLINLSIYIVAFMVDLFNVLGEGVGQIITSPLNAYDLGVELSTLAGLVTFIGILLGIGLAIVIAYGIRNSLRGAQGRNTLSARIFVYLGVFFGIPLLLTVLAIFATLVIRQGAIMLLAVISPVAMALFVMPATEQYSRKWFDAFFKALLVYPIIVALFALAGVLAVLMSQGAGGIDLEELILVAISGIGIGAVFNPIAGGAVAVGGLLLADAGAIFRSLLSVIVLFIPLAMIPFAFKLAGGFMGSLFNAASSARNKYGSWLQQEKHSPESKIRSLRPSTRESFVAARDESAKRIKAGGEKGKTAFEAIGGRVPGFRSRVARRRAVRQGNNPDLQPSLPSNPAKGGSGGGAGAVAGRQRRDTQTDRRRRSTGGGSTRWGAVPPQGGPNTGGNEPDDNGPIIPPPDGGFVDQGGIPLPDTESTASDNDSDDSGAPANTGGGGAPYRPFTMPAGESSPYTPPRPVGFDPSSIPGTSSGDGQPRQGAAESTSTATPGSTVRPQVYTPPQTSSQQAAGETTRSGSNAPNGRTDGRRIQLDGSELYVPSTEEVETINKETKQYNAAQQAAQFTEENTVTNNRDETAEESNEGNEETS
jgi:hypothetical protein